MHDHTFAVTVIPSIKTRQLLAFSRRKLGLSVHIFSIGYLKSNQIDN